MSVRSLRAAVRRSPVLLGAAALSATLVLSGCAEDGVEDEVEEGVEDVDNLEDDEEVEDDE